MSEQAQMATAIINQIIGMQSVEDQRVVLSEVFKRYSLPTSERYEILTDQQAAERYGVHIRTLQDWLLSGELKGFKEARKWYTRTDWMREFEDARAAESHKVRRRFAQIGAHSS